MTEVTVPQVLLLDDDESDAELVVHEIDKARVACAVSRIRTRGEFIEALKRQTWDLVLCDYVIPGFGAIEALEMMGALKPRPSFVVISGKVGEEITAASMNAGACDYILKDNLRRLSAVVRRELGESRLRRERIAAESELRRAQRLQLLGTFAGAVAHDFNNILGALIGYGELAREQLRIGKPPNEEVEQVVSSGHRARAVVKRLLRFAAGGSTDYLPVSLESITAEALGILRYAIPPHVSISFDPSGSVPPVSGDEVALLQVVMNLLTNAVRAIEGADGTIEIRCLPTTSEDTPIPGIPLSSGTDGVRYSIRDTGRGIPEEIKGRIFDPFFTTRMPGEGNGLGLWSVRRIIAEHGGSIRCESSPGVGTVFDLYFPIAARPSSR